MLGTVIQRAVAGVRSLGGRKKKATPSGDMDLEFTALYERCRPYSMVAVERLYALYQATEYVVRCGIPGAIVECGVWRGGAMMLAALTLERLGDTGRTLYLYDTFAGMSEPSDRDVSIKGTRAAVKWRTLRREAGSTWAYASRAEVEANLASTGYPRARLVFVEGKVEDTIPRVVPETIAILRLDTDWYDSTYHELTHLFPRLAVGGVLLLDDYGHWQGAREATDRYMREQRPRILLTRIDRSGRLAIKP